MRKTDWLVYTGGATTRKITKDEWAAVDVIDQDTVVFGAANRKRVRVGDLSEAAVAILLENHGNEFRVIGTGPKTAT